MSGTPLVHGGIPVDIWSRADAIAYVEPVSDRMARICHALVTEREAGAAALAKSEEARETAERELAEERDETMWRFWTAKAGDLATKLDASEASLSQALARIEELEKALELGVPGKFCINATAIANLAFQCGANENNTEFFDAIAWVGELEGDADEPAVYGLHAYSTEYPEDGSVTLAEFATPIDGGKG